MDVTQMYISEFVGTAVLLAFGNSTNASILLKKTIVGIYGTNWLHIIFEIGRVTSRKKLSFMM